MALFEKGYTPWNKGKTWKKKNLKYTIEAPYTRNCPSCSTPRTYSDKYTFTYAIKKNRKCNKCANKGKGFQSRNYTYERTPEINQKSRVSHIKYIESCKGKCIPAYNKNSIPILEQVALDLGITDLIHAENGGEFKVCGYFVDGYSPSKNIVLEYDEKHHYTSESILREKDIQRQAEIEEYLKCTFIRIKEEI